MKKDHLQENRSRIKEKVSPRRARFGAVSAQLLSLLRREVPQRDLAGQRDLVMFRAGGNRGWKQVGVALRCLSLGLGEGKRLCPTLPL